MLHYFIFYYQPFIDRKVLYEYVQSYFWSDEWMSIFFGIMLPIILRIIYGMFYLICYRLDYDFINKWKTNDKWMWEKDKDKYNALIKRTLKSTAINYMLLIIPSSIFGYNTMIENGMSFSPHDIPEWYVSFAHIMINLFIFDFVFYWMHKLLHHRSFYWIHKMHHEYVETSVWASMHAHPIDYFLSSILPASLTLFICPMHYYTFLMFLIVINLSDISHHCGYDFLINMPLDLIPFGDINKMHSDHHKYYNCNYAGIFPFMDILFGTKK